MSSKGQSMLELIVVIAVGIVVISALVFSTISSIRNSQLSKNQSQATRLAQEGLEKVRVSRERNQSIVCAPCTPQNPLEPRFSDLWSTVFSCTSPINCYFKFNSSGLLQSASVSDLEFFTEDLKPFTRQVLIEDNATPLPNEKKFTVKVFWTDFAGQHESKQTTLLRKL